MTPEERIANLWRDERMVSDPIDIASFAKYFAEIEYDEIPGRCDGLLIGKGKDRPTIVINKNISPTRQVFTIGHELGHLLIPWHNNSMFLDDLDNVIKLPKNRTAEAEANRFASELLMPSSWVSSVLNTSDTIKSAVDTIAQSGASVEAIVKKIVTSCQIPLVHVQVDNRNCVTDARQSNSSIAPLPRRQSVVGPSLYQGISCETIIHHKSRLYFWFLDEIRNVPSLSLSYLSQESSKKILKEIIAELQAEKPNFDFKKLTQLINSRFGGINSMYMQFKSSGREYDVRTRLIDSMTFGEEVYDFIRHPEFLRYIDAAVLEIKSR